MKVGDFLKDLNDRQKKTVLQCAESCGIPDLEAEIDFEIEENLIKFLKAISNPLRLKMLKLLKDNWLCVCLISKILNQDQTLISHHIKTLKSLDLILERKEGKMHFYKTNVETLARYLEKLHVDLV